MENIALLANSTENNFTGVNLYCDDEAAFVEAPLNPRASEIAACCGRALEARTALCGKFAPLGTETEVF